jgi:hypothetical protein
MRLVPMLWTLGLAVLSVGVVTSASAGLPRRTFRDPIARISLDYPTMWHVTREAYAPFSDPVPRFVVYSGTLNTATLKPNRPR